MSDNQVQRQSLEVDIVCAGFGPATGGFLTTLSKALMNADGTPALQSRACPGMPLQVMCYERADDLGFGVSGVVTRGRGIKASFPDIAKADFPMLAPVKKEKVAYLLDPIGASRRPASLKLADAAVNAFKWLLPVRNQALELPYIPPFLQKHGGFVLSIGQFNQWVGSQLMAGGLVQVWPGMPVKEPLFENDCVTGLRLADQGVNKNGQPEGAAYMPGMDIKAALTVIGDGPVGTVGQKLNERFGFPEGHHQRDWAIGMKMAVELPEDSSLEPGTVFHTFGYPEPEIFGFMYVFPNRIASLGLFVPSWFDSPVRTAYRYLQHWMQHPYLWQHLKGAALRSWGAKSLQEAGKRGEPCLVGDGFARIGEGSGSTNVLTGSGVDEAWQTGVQLAEGVVQLAKEGKPFTKENLQKAYVGRRRASSLQKELDVAERSRDGFQKGFVWGLLGMGITGMSGGKLNLSGPSKRPWERIPTLEEYYAGNISKEELEQIKKTCAASKQPLHDALMEKAGWPKLEFDGKLIVSHQDALLMGGKVQAPAGFADHVLFLYPNLCEKCGSKVCIEACSGQAISPGEDGGIPSFDREKCVHCGACLWNCASARPGDPERALIQFGAGAGGLHSAEN